MSQKKIHPDVFLPKCSVSITATDSNGEPCHIELEFTNQQRTLLISYDQKEEKIQISELGSDKNIPRVFTVGYGKKGLKIKREKGADTKHRDKPEQNSVLHTRTPKGRLFLTNDD